MSREYMNLDNLTPNQTRKLNKIAKDYAEKYTELIDNLSEKYGTDDFWWYTMLVSRNTQLCDCFQNICLTKLVFDEIQSGRRKIRINLPAISKVLKRNNIRFEAIGHPRFKIKDVVKRFAKVPYALYSYLKFVKKIFTGRTRGVEKIEYLKTCTTLVDTYLLASEFSGNTFKDRYFPGLCGENVKFLAVLEYSSGADGRKLAERAASLENYFNVNNWCTQADFREMFSYARWCLHLHIEKAMIDGIDYSPIFEEALIKELSLGNAFLGILKGNIINRFISEQRVPIHMVVGWYEGQPCSNAMFYKIRKQNPQIVTIGYVQPVQENNLGQVPAKGQYQAGACPEYYAIQGKAWIESIRRFEIQTKYVIAPSFRYQNVFVTPQKRGKRSGVLVVLPYEKNICQQLILDFICVGERLNGLEVHFKNHPRDEKRQLIDYVPNVTFPKTFDIIKGKLPELSYASAFVVVCETSSSLENMLTGTPVILYASNAGLLNTSVPEIYQKYLPIAYDADDLFNFLTTDGSTSLNDELIETIRNDCFTSVNEDTIRTFIEFGSKDVDEETQ